MRLNEINASSARKPDADHPQAEPASGAPANESRALVALAPTSDAAERQAGHRHAPFVAHLIAVKDQHPQTRERRRVAPNEASAAYLATAALTGH